MKEFRISIGFRIFVVEEDAPLDVILVKSESFAGEGAFYLHELDLTMARSGLFYVRLWTIFWCWRPRAGFGATPDKAFIGRIAQGFDFLGYYFSPQGLTLAAQTRANFVERCNPAL